MTSTRKESALPQRRGFLKQIAAVAGGLPFSSGLVSGSVVGASLDAVAARAAPQDPQTTDPVVGYISFSQDEAAFVEAMVTIMCPADEFTPNGVDCGLAIYIDRQIAGDFGKGAKRYLRGPWAPGKPQQGYQLPMTPEQHFKAGIAAANAACQAKYGKPFDQIAPADASAFLSDLCAGKVSDPSLPLESWFNELEAG